MRYSSRNDTLGFAHRTRKNMDFIQGAYAAGEDVHVVTQLVISLLGLIVYPKERRLVERVKSLKLSELQTKGWPTWHIEVGKSETLHEFLRMLRNAIAHGHVHFSSDDRAMENVNIKFENYGNANRLTWRAEISSPKLNEFCRQFIRLIDDTVG